MCSGYCALERCAENVSALNQAYVHTAAAGLYGGVHNIEGTAILIDLHTQQAQEGSAQTRIDLKAKGDFTHHCTGAWKHKPGSFTSNYRYGPQQLSNTVFWDVALCSQADRYQSFGEKFMPPCSGQMTQQVLPKCSYLFTNIHSIASR
jgi:hypothetical protein